MARLRPDRFCPDVYNPGELARVRDYSDRIFSTLPIPCPLDGSIIRVTSAVIAPANLIFFLAVYASGSERRMW